MRRNDGSKDLDPNSRRNVWRPMNARRSGRLNSLTKCRHRNAREQEDVCAFPSSLYKQLIKLLFDPQGEHRPNRRHYYKRHSPKLRRFKRLCIPRERTPRLVAEDPTASSPTHGPSCQPLIPLHPIVYPLILFTSVRSQAQAPPTHHQEVHPQHLFPLHQYPGYPQI